MTAFCSFATQRIIPPGPNDPPITPRLVILHVDAGNAESLFEFFRDRSGGIESHFFVKKTGEIEQYRGILDQADANLDANDFAVSIETQGFAEGEWTAEQLASIKRLLLWLRDIAGIPLIKVPTWDGSGVGYHVQFGAPSHWTPSVKTCPGPDRIAQFNAVLVPWMADPQEEDVTPEQEDRIVYRTADRVLSNLGDGRISTDPDNPIAEKWSLARFKAGDRNLANQSLGLQRQVLALQKQLQEAEAQTLALVRQLQEGEVQITKDAVVAALKALAAMVAA